MLQIRPNCEWCDRDLPPDAVEAMICSYECTFCLDCVDAHLKNVCPNCGGGFERRPLRPKTARRPGVSLGHQPASDRRVHLKFDRSELKAFLQAHEHVPPNAR